MLNYGQRNKDCYDGIVRRQDTAISEISPLEVVNADTGNELHLIFGTVLPCFPCFLFIGAAADSQRRHTRLIGAMKNSQKITCNLLAACYDGSEIKGALRSDGNERVNVPCWSF